MGWDRPAPGLPPVEGCHLWPASIAILPAAFGRLHPKYNSPYVSLMSQAGIAAVFIFLGQAGTTVKGAYDVLVSMSIISYFIPYLLMFASMIRLQGEPAGPEVIRVPGGRRVAIGLAGLGFATTVVSHRSGADPRRRRSQQAAGGEQNRGPYAAARSSPARWCTLWGGGDATNLISSSWTPAEPSDFSTSRSNCTDRLSRFEYGPGR